MKTSILGLALGITILAADPPKPSDWSQEPDAFTGIQFNSSKADTIAALLARNDRFRTCGKSAGGGSVCDGVTLKLADASASLIFTFSSDDKFAGVLGTFPPSDFDTIREVFAQRYGVPHVVTPKTVQTAAGAKYEDLTLEWKGKTLDILLEKYADKVTRGMFSVTLHALSDADAKAKEDAKKKAADKL